MPIGNSSSQIVFQRDGKILVTPGPNRADVAACTRLCGQLEAITAGSYRFALSPVAIWGAAARGLSAAALLDQLEQHSYGPMPGPVAARIAELHHRYGLIWIERAGVQARIHARDVSLLHQCGVTPGQTIGRAQEVEIKRTLAAHGWPVVDDGSVDQLGELSVELKSEVQLRPYQRAAVEAHMQARNGLILLPCGAGKTIVGVGVIAAARAPTLILVPSREIAAQWERTLLDSTTINAKDVATLPRSVTRSVTITTYQSASRGQIQTALASAAWGLVIYDEVQSLPAEVFRTVSAFSATRRLGLSATLVREDGREAEIFAMVGPVVFDLPWVELERDGWLAPARCYEVRIPAASSGRDRTIYKTAVVERLLERSGERPTLVVGSQLDALANAAGRLNLPLLTGKDGPERRAATFDAFRRGEITRLAVSRIGSTGLDLPTAEVMIQINGNFGSRQEEAQRLGRLLRPGNGQAVDFYTLVSLGTRESEYAQRRQRFLVDQGYEYEILDAAELPRVERGVRD